MTEAWLIRGSFEDIIEPNHGAVFELGQTVEVLGVLDDDVCWEPDDDGEDDHCALRFVGRKGRVVGISTGMAFFGEYKPDGLKLSPPTPLNVGETPEDPMFVVRFRAHRGTVDEIFWGEELA